MKKQADLLNELVKLYRQEWGDNAVEALLGVLSTVVTDEQLQKLVDLKRLTITTKNNEYITKMEDISVRQDQ